MKDTILVVEDNEDNYRLLEDLFTHEGYNVIIVTDGADVLETVNKNEIDLVLLDMQLPGMDGYDVANILKTDENTNKIPIIAVTAYAMKGDREKTLEAGCDDYISKPIDINEIRKKVKQYIDK